jgi:transglutaminase-like putative cysteine protease
MNHPMSVFRLSVLAMICLSTLTLTIAEGSLFPTVLTIPIAVFTYFYTDLRKSVVIDATIAAIFGILAIMATGFEFFSGTEQRILSSAHLVSYFIWIVLLQEKRLQNYWTLAALSLLQMAIAAVLTNHVFYGFLTILYVMISTWTLVVFSVYRAGLRVRMVSENQERKVKEPEKESVVPTSIFGIKRDPMAYLNPGHSSSRGSIHLDSGRQWITSGLVAGVCMISLISIAIGGLFFAGTPRVWLNRMAYSGEMPGSPLISSMTGFTESVQLGQTGNIRENNQTAMYVQFQDYDAAINMPEENRPRLHIPDMSVRWGYDLPLFRASALEHYSNGRWETVVNQRQTYPAPEVPTSGRYVRQKFILETVQSPRIFAMQPIVATDQTRAPTIFINYLNDTVIMRRRGGVDSLEYALYTPASSEGLQPRHDITPVSMEKYDDLVNTKYIKASLQLPEDPGMSELVSLARQWKADAEKSKKRALTNREVMEVFEQRFLNSPEFSYTLNQEVANPNIDPVLDFLFNRRKGHCEYFASAMVLMLRAVDIPARMAGGFKGGQWNDTRKELTVLQRFAHTWVEALDENKAKNRYEWITLDPTPAIRNQELGANSGDETKRAFGFSDDFWKNYVIGMSFARQKELLYQPFLNNMKSLYDSVFNKGQFFEIAKQVVMEFIRHPERLFSWQGGLIVGSFFAVVIGFVWFTSRFFRFLRGRGLLKTRGAARQRAIIEFYERFQKLMRAYQLQRESSQTHREFADVCHETLEPMFPTHTRIEGIDELTDAYYAWRFGHQQIPEERVSELMRTLDQIEKLLTSAKPQVAKA